MLYNRIMKNIIRGVLILAAIVGFATLPTSIVSAGAKESVQNGTNQVKDEASSGSDFNGIIDKVVNTMLFIVGILAVVMIIYSGIRYITAHGDKSQVESAKNTLIYSIVGLVVAIVAYAVVNWVVGLF